MSCWTLTLGPRRPRPRKKIVGFRFPDPQVFEDFLQICWLKIAIFGIISVKKKSVFLKRSKDECLPTYPICSLIMKLERIYLSSLASPAPNPSFMTLLITASHLGQETEMFVSIFWTGPTPNKDNAWWNMGIRL